MQNNPENSLSYICFIPKEIRENYEKNVEEFYEKGGKEETEAFAKTLEKKFNVKFERLGWTDEEGLRNISFALGGLDLNKNRTQYSFHNIFPISPHGQAAFKLAERYIELLEGNL